MIIDKIKNENIQALRNKNSVARGLYSVLLNKHMLAEIEKRANGEHMQDTDTIKLIQKMIKELTEEAENYKKAGNLDEEANVLNQKALLDGYLPKLLTEDEIKAIIESLDDKSIQAVMKHFKEHYLGKCDMGLVNKSLR